jgi:hypothetical protein
MVSADFALSFEVESWLCSESGLSFAREFAGRVLFDGEALLEFAGSGHGCFSVTVPTGAHAPGDTLAVVIDMETDYDKTLHYRLGPTAAAETSVSALKALFR